MLPLPAMVPGFTTQLPAGKPPNTKLPVATSQAGWVIEFTVGAEGIIGLIFMTTLADADEVHPTEFVTIKL